MKEHNFVLTFDVRDSDNDPSHYVELLGAHGCTDALIGLGKKGYISLDFAREAESAYRAVISALKNIREALPQAILVEATPDLVSLTDIAQILDCTRQNARKLLIDNGSEAPSPVHQGSSSLWCLAEVLAWLQKKGYPIDEDVLELAHVNMEVNVYKRRPKTVIDQNQKKEIANLV